MGKTIAEKILGKNNLAGSEVRAGDYIDARIDGAFLFISFDQLYHSLVKAGFPDGLPSVWDREKVYYFMDHFQPAPDRKFAEMNYWGRVQAEKLGLTHFYDSIPAVGHQAAVERGYARPGELIVGNDSHSTFYGALNAATTGIGELDMAYALAFGELWFQVPHTIRVELNGSARPYPFAKDVMLHLAGLHGDDFAQYRALEFAGRAVSEMTLADRFCLSTQSIEVGAKFGLMEADAKVEEFLRGRTDRPYAPVSPDPDADYERIISVDVDSLPFFVAKPHSFGNAVPVGEAAGTRIDQALVGSCANGRYEDMELTARMLRGRKLPPRVRLVVQPATWEIFRRCMHDGLVDVILDAGAQFVHPGCGVCQSYQGHLAAGEVCITSATRNFRGRLGSADADIYLGGPATVVASALRGEITDPKEALDAVY